MQHVLSPRTRTRCDDGLLEPVTVTERHARLMGAIMMLRNVSFDAVKVSAVGNKCVLTVDAKNHRVVNVTPGKPACQVPAKRRCLSVLSRSVCVNLSVHR